MADEQAAPATDANKLRKAYGTATQMLRDKHRDDFNALYSKEAAKLGVEWKPRATGEEKAAKQLMSILGEYPALAETLRQSAAARPAETPPAQ